MPLTVSSETARVGAEPVTLVGTRGTGTVVAGGGRGARLCLPSRGTAAEPPGPCDLPRGHSPRLPGDLPARLAGPGWRFAAPWLRWGGQPCRGPPSWSRRPPLSALGPRPACLRLSPLGLGASQLPPAPPPWVSARVQSTAVHVRDPVRAAWAWSGWGVCPFPRAALREQQFRNVGAQSSQLSAFWWRRPEHRHTEPASGSGQPGRGYVTAT